MPKLHWKKTWDKGEPKNGTPDGLASGSPHHTTECGDVEILPALGYSKVIEEDSKRFHRGGIEKVINSNPCGMQGNPTFRDYPTFGFHKANSKFNLPVLVRIDMRVVAESFASLTKHQFSQFTCKGRKPKSPDDQIMTSHILEDGYLDIGHADMTTQHKHVKIPLNEWHVQSFHIYTNPLNETETKMEAYINNDLTIRAICKGHWKDGQLRNTHAGSYFLAKSYPIEPFFIDNDNYMVNEVDVREEALSLIKQSVDSLSNVIKPPDIKRVTVTWQPEGLKVDTE